MLAGMALRSVGCTRGTSDFVLPEGQAAGYETAFYAFHPDEVSLINGALKEFDLFSPPYTSYGTLPPYLLGGLLRLFDLHEGRYELSATPPDFRRSVYFLARVLAILFSLGVLVLAAVLTRKLYDRWAALAATAVVAFAPGAIQQAHFFITDGAFALASLAALWAIVLACEGPPTWRRFVLAGLLIGATACIRFHGGLLGMIFVGVLWCRVPGSVSVRSISVVRDVRLWVAGGISIGLLLLLHPYVLTRPELISRASHVGDVALALKFASGEYLQPWTLVDAHVIPYVDHWFGMWPLVVGWPLTVGFLATFVWAILRGRWQERVLATWCLLYFLPVGMLDARALRHLVPILSILAILSAGAVLDLLRVVHQSRVRRGVAFVGIALGFHLFVYGTSFARIYLVEDSRIRAARFLANKIRPGTMVGLETGAFRVTDLVDKKRYPYRWLDTSMLLYSGPYMLCADRVDYLQNKLAPVGAMIYVKENRAVQYAAVPELFPIAASFYEELSNGGLGLDVGRQFKTYPNFSGIRFAQADADPTLSAYDHPTVNVLMRRDDADFETTFDRWRRDLQSNPWCPDNALHEAAVGLRAGDAEGALAIVQAQIAANPNALISYRVEAEILRQMGDSQGQTRAMARFEPETTGGRMAHVVNPRMVHFVTASTALSLIRLGMYEEALQELRRGMTQEHSDVPRARRLRALSYLRAAVGFGATGHPEHAQAVINMSMQIHRTADALNALAEIEFHAGNLREALQLLAQSVLVHNDQAKTHLRLAELYLTVDADVDRALVHLSLARELDPFLHEMAAQLRQQIDALQASP